MTSSTASATTANRTKDGVPLWDGDPGSFQEFCESARLYEQSIAFHKRATVGPRLASELSGAARRQVTGKPADWLSFPGGVEVLLEHLRQGLGQPRIVEVTEHLGRYFRQSKRRSGESINEYVARKNEVYLRAQQAMARVQPVYQQSTTTSWQPRTTVSPSWNNWGSRRSSIDSQGDDDGEATTTASTAEAAAPEGDTAWNTGNGSWNWRGGYYGSWNDWGSGWSWQGWGTWPSEARQKPEPLPELLPDFVQGWMLLQDAGLDATEKSLVQATLGENYSTRAVAHALRTHFSDSDIRKRDHGRRQQGFWGETADDDLEAEPTETDHGFAAGELLNEEGFTAWTEAQDEINEAMAVINHGRRTLKEARAKQHSVKLSRQYFKSYNRSGPSSSSAASSGPPRNRDEAITCLKCGKLGHRASNCTQPQAANHVDEESAAFTFYTELQEEPQDEALVAAPTTSQAVESGKAVLDSGATRSIGSIAALEKVMALNYQKTGKNRVLNIDNNERPIFGFGNSSTDQCASTMTLGVTAGGRPGAFRVHALDRGDGPLLLSIDALRSLGAIIDYDNDLMVLRRVDPYKIVPLERSATGHHLLSMTQDLFTNAINVLKGVPSLRDFLSADDFSQSE